MLRSVKELEGCTVGATDGTIGKVTDFYFDDEDWVVRYLIVETGSWLSNRKVLISPISIGAPDWSARILPVSITTDQVRHSPHIDTDKPVSRQHEMEYFGYYGYYPYYWGGAGLWGGSTSPGILAPNAGYAGRYTDPRRYQADPIAEGFGGRQREDADPHLRSCRAVTGYHIQATDGSVGHVQGWLIDDDTWAVRYVVVNTSNWWLGHQVLIAPQWIESVRWAHNTVHVALTREAVKAAPRYDSSAPPDRDQEISLYLHHGRPGYWADAVDSTSGDHRADADAAAISSGRGGPRH